MPESSIQDKAKDAAGKAAAQLIQNGMAIGLGTGSTVAYFLYHLGIRCKEGLKISGLPTSNKTAELAMKNSIPLIDPLTVFELDLAIDGADEIDKNKQMIKGGGGALLREKISASMAREMIVIVDEKKCVEKLGAFSLPVEIAPFGLNATLKHLKSAGFYPILRSSFISDNGNYIADLKLNKLIDDPIKLDLQLRKISGILETGLFINLAKTVIIGHPDGNASILK